MWLSLFLPFLASLLPMPPSLLLLPPRQSMAFWYLNILKSLTYKSGVLVASPYVNSEELIPDLVDLANRAGGGINFSKSCYSAHTNRGLESCLGPLHKLLFDLHLYFAWGPEVTTHRRLESIGKLLNSLVSLILPCVLHQRS